MSKETVTTEITSEDELFLERECHEHERTWRMYFTSEGINAQYDMLSLDITKRLISSYDPDTFFYDLKFIWRNHGKQLKWKKWKISEVEIEDLVALAQFILYVAKHHDEEVMNYLATKYDKEREKKREICDVS